MDLPLPSPAKCELHSVIRFLSAKNTTPVDIHSQLCEVYGDKCMTIKHVRKWCKWFKEGRKDVHDERRSGRPSTSDEMVAQVEKTMLRDRRLTTYELSEMIPDVSKSNIHRILTDKLGYVKVCARWVPRMLSEERNAHKGFVSPSRQRSSPHRPCNS